MYQDSELRRSAIKLYELSILNSGSQLLFLQVMYIFLLIQDRAIFASNIKVDRFQK